MNRRSSPRSADTHRGTGGAPALRFGLALALVGVLAGVGGWLLLRSGDESTHVARPPEAEESQAIPGPIDGPATSAEDARGVVEEEAVDEEPAPVLVPVTVRIVDGPDEEPASGTPCELLHESSSDSVPTRGVTDETGTVAFSIEEGRYLRLVRAWATEHQAVDLTVEARLTTERSWEYCITLPPLGVLRGRVVDPEGNGVADCEVHGFAKHFAHGKRFFFPEPRRLAHSGVDGCFEIHDVTGHFELEARLAGHHGLCRIEGDVAPGESLEHLRLVVVPVRDLAVTVVDPEGAPLTGVRVYASAVDRGRGAARGFSEECGYEGEGTSDAMGRLVLTDLPRVPMRIRCHPEQHCYHSEEVRADADAWTLQVGPAHEPLRVTGVVRGPDGAPVEGARIHASLPERGPDAKTNAKGEFEATAWFVHDPTYESVREHNLFVFAEGLAPRLVQPLTLSPGDNHYVIVLDPARELAGVVLDAEGRPVPKASIWLHSDLEVWPGMDHVAWSENKYHRTDEEGRFRMGSLGSGEHRLLVREGVGSPFRGFRVQAGRTDLVLRLDEPDPGFVRFRVRVVDAETGAPVERFLGQVLDRRGGGGGTVDAPDGWWEPRPRLPGSYRIRVRGDEIGRERAEHAAAHVPMREYAAGLHEIELRLHRPAPLRLRVVDASDRPVAGVTVLPRDLTGELLSYDDQVPRLDIHHTLPKTGRDGRCWFESLPRGIVRLELIPPDGSPSRTVDVDLATQGTEELVVRL